MLPYLEPGLIQASTETKLTGMLDMQEKATSDPACVKCPTALGGRVHA